MTRAARGEGLQLRLARVGMLIALILMLGTLGYKFLSQSKASWLDCFYMTVVAVTTLGAR